jgi:uncharacterized membrane protein
VTGEHAFSRRAQSPPEPAAPAAPEAPQRRARGPLDVRRSVVAAALALDLATLLLVLTHVHGHVRQVLGLLACLVVPGLALVGLVRLGDWVLELGCTISVGLASLVLVAQLALTAHAWHPFAIEVVVLAACAPSLVLQLRPARSATT